MVSELSPGASNSPSPLRDGMSPFQRRVQWIIFGPNGFRAGWRILIAITLFLVFLIGLQAGLLRIPAIHTWLHGRAKGAATPGLILFSEGISVLSLALSVFIMALIEKRSFAQYGLPGGEAFGKRFWQGIPCGFVMVTLLMAVIGALHGFSIEGLALHGGAVAKYAFLYLLAFILVAIFEEFSFRGYLQSTLASGIGFWPAAILLAVAFGAVHLGNAGEAKFGALMAGSFGLLEAFTLLRTGNLWFPIGMHAAWDWGETYFYAVPDSGIVANGHLMNSSFHGPNWLTGGTVGPEGSLLVFPVLLLWAAIIHFMFPARRANS
jgi:membrane protease YdiL (CAAX protease family)